MAIQLDIREQPRLPILRQVEITADGVHHRLLRSLITLSVIVLATAFLMNILTESSIAGACKAGIFARCEEERDLERFLHLFQRQRSADELQQFLAQLPAHSWQLPVLAQWLGADAPDLTQLHQQIRAADSASQWFDELKLGHRRILLGNRERAQAFTFLSDAAQRQQFAQAARQIPLTLPGGLLDSLSQYPDYRQRLDQVSQRFASHLESLHQALAGTSLLERFAAAAQDSAQQQELAKLLQEQKLELPAQRLDWLSQRAHQRQQREQLSALLAQPELASAWNRQFASIYRRDQALAELAAPDKAQWLSQWITERKEQGLPQLAATAAAAAQSQELSDLENKIIADYGPNPGVSTRVFWLIVVSLMVCTVGIANAMLISVIERFREIATMKCLGALDGFIATLFLLEAAFLGLIGGLVGVLLGLLIGLLRMLSGYGGWVFQFFPAGDLSKMAALAVVCGVGLAVLAAIYPAYSASRMPPMEAMRVQ